jgi:hypothetical protein
MYRNYIQLAAAGGVGDNPAPAQLSVFEFGTLAAAGEIPNTGANAAEVKTLNLDSRTSHAMTMAALTIAVDGSAPAPPAVPAAAAAPRVSSMNLFSIPR